MNIEKKFKIVAISDVHEQWHNLVIPECDLLISAGDYSYRGKPNVVRDFHGWLDLQPAKHIISVQGNHEMWVEKHFETAKAIAQKVCPRVHFIDEGLVEIEGKKIWCSAITPEFNNYAWNRYPDQIKEHWDKIPLDTDILVTHGPPYMILDYAPICGHVGCPELYQKILELKNLKAHFFGHIHDSHGYKRFNNIDFYNASICTESYNPNNLVTVYEMD